MYTTVQYMCCLDNKLVWRTNALYEVRTSLQVDSCIYEDVMTHLQGLLVKCSKSSELARL